MNINITFCVQWNYRPRAARLAVEIESEFSVLSRLIESSGGVFEIEVDGTLVFSKKKLERFPYENEILEIIREIHSN